MSFACRPPIEQRKPRVQANTPEILASKGWSTPKAAAFLGCDVSHLWRVAIGERPSKRLMAKIKALPKI